MATFTRKVNWHDDALFERLGTVPDAQLARELNVTPDTIGRMRRRAEIPANYGRTKRKPRDLPPALIARLGQATDAELAREFQVSYAIVREARIQRGIVCHQVRKHGTKHMYVKEHCRCDACVEANRVSAAAWHKANPQKFAAMRKRQKERVFATAPHAIGRIAWYVLGCRCEGCKKVEAERGKTRSSRATCPTT